MTGVLTNISNELADTVEKAGNGIARIEARRRMPASGIIWSPDGVIVTSHHVVEQDDNIKIGLPDGQTMAATLVGRDPTTDIAVLRAQATGLTPPTWASNDDLRVGHLVLGLGRLGQTVLATLGIVSALGKSWRTPAGGHMDSYLQTDIAMYPGFSGGPLVDAAGQVLGINTSALLRGISLTIPTATVRQVVETLLANGKVRRGYLGIGAGPVRLPKALAEKLGQETGLLLNSVEQDSPAERGGLVFGDTIVSADGEPVRHMDDLLALLSGERVGTEVSVKIVRGGQTQDVTVTIGERS